jgi:hypothetical protein
VNELISNEAALAGIFICVLLLWNVIQNVQIRALREKADKRVPSMQELADVHACHNTLEARLNVLADELSELDDDDCYNAQQLLRTIEKLFLAHFNVNPEGLRKLIEKCRDEAEEEINKEWEKDEDGTESDSIAAEFDIPPHVEELIKTLRAREVTDEPSHVAILTPKGVRPSTEAMTLAYAVAAHMGLDDIRIIES